MPRVTRKQARLEKLKLESGAESFPSSPLSDISNQYNIQTKSTKKVRSLKRKTQVKKEPRIKKVVQVKKELCIDQISAARFEAYSR